MLFCKQTPIPYQKLTEDKKKCLMRIVQNTKLAKIHVSQREKKAEVKGKPLNGDTSKKQPFLQSYSFYSKTFLHHLSVLFTHITDDSPHSMLLGTCSGCP